MPFKFLSYVRPSWYYNNLSLEAQKKYFNATIDPNGDYNIPEGYSDAGVVSDIAYQNWLRGFGLTSCNNKNPITLNNSPKDNYIFLRRYYNRLWSFYVLLIRILSGKNPFLELKYFFLARGVQKFDSFGVDFTNCKQEVKVHSTNFNGLVSIIIPTLNRYEYLYDALKDLENQSFNKLEVVIVDQSNPFDIKFYDQFDLNMQIIRQEEKKLWKARNEAIIQSNGHYVLLFDDDSRVPFDWVQNHINCLEYFDCDISAGVSLAEVGSKIAKSYSVFRWSDQLDTGNVMLTKRVFKEIGLFDEQFEKMRMGDAEFGHRAFLNDFNLVSNPIAYRNHLKVSSGGLRQMGSWDAFRPIGLLKPKPVPSVLYYYRRYLPLKSAFLGTIIGVSLSFARYHKKSSRLSLYLGVIKSIFLFPIVFYQVFSSFIKSSSMINSGPKIRSLSKNQ